MAEEKLQNTEELEATATEAAIVDTTEGAAKAGKRSAKAIKEAEEKADKEARKEAGDTTPQNEADATQKRGPVPVPRPLIERRGKAYRKLTEKIEAGKAYNLKEALALATETSPVKFDASVELHIKLGVDPRHADQNIRATVSLPQGTGKKVRVAVFAPAAQHEAAKKAGADIVAEDEFLQQLDKEELNFDILIATPQLMAKLGKYARLLGPKGLMPNPKSGTVTANVAEAVKEAKAGKIEFRVDKQAIVHLSVGKVSFGADKLQDNAKAVIDAIMAAKPASVKGTYLQGLTVASTMGPGVKVDVSSL